LLIRGEISDSGASGDLHDIEALTGTASLEPHLSAAKEILLERRVQLGRITAALRENLWGAEERYLGPLPNNHVGAWLLDESQLMQCLNAAPITPGQ
jgi:hypothetical protein